jgi:hypothetical protein
LRSPGFDHALNAIACRIDNVTREGRADMFEAFRLARRDIETPHGMGSPGIETAKGEGSP